MLWFNGSIAEAVNLSKQRNAIFVVFVEGENDLSSEMAATLNDSVIMKRLSDLSSFLAIKLKSGSTDYTHFAQIYQFVPVPSLFFIGRNGTPLEVVCAGVQADNLAKRIDRILEEHQKNKHTTQPSTSSQNLKEQTASLLQSETAASAPAAGNTVKPPEAYVKPETSSGPSKSEKTEYNEITKSGQEYDVVCDGDVCVRKPKVNIDDAGPSKPAETPEKYKEENKSIESEASDTNLEQQKVDRVKQLIEVRKREKEEAEKQLEKQKELERRAVGHGVVELKRWQQDQELKQIQEERKREKMENNLARQRILQQIAQDRAERKARDVPQPSQVQEAPMPQTSGGDGSGGARVQFKLPDGTSHTAHFEADNTLDHLNRYLTEKLHLSNFSLWMAFPRRELTENDATLRQLQIAPSAALLVVQRHATNNSTVTSPSMISNVLTMLSQFFSSFIMDPAQQLYDWIRSRLFPPSNPSTSRNPPRDSSPTSRNSPQSQTVRQRGNIHRLPGERPEDDDNNTWNGNSTQQM